MPCTATFLPVSFMFKVPLCARQWLMQRQQPMHSSEMTRSFCITGMYDGQTWVQTPHETQVFLSRVTLTGEEHGKDPNQRSVGAEKAAERVAHRQGGRARGKR